MIDEKKKEDEIVGEKKDGTSEEMKQEPLPLPKAKMKKKNYTRTTKNKLLEDELQIPITKDTLKALYLACYDLLEGFSSSKAHVHPEMTPLVCFKARYSIERRLAGLPQEGYVEIGQRFGSNHGVPSKRTNDALEFLKKKRTKEKVTEQMRIYMPALLVTPVPKAIKVGSTAPSFLKEVPVEMPAYEMPEHRESFEPLEREEVIVGDDFEEEEISDITPASSELISELRRLDRKTKFDWIHLVLFGSTMLLIGGLVVDKLLH